MHPCRSAVVAALCGGFGPGSDLALFDELRPFHTHVEKLFEDLDAHRTLAQSGFRKFLQTVSLEPRAPSSELHVPSC
jgi:hypothetical protein